MLSIIKQKKVLIVVCVFLITVFVLKPVVEDSMRSYIVATPELSESLRNVHRSQHVEDNYSWSVEIGSRFESRKASLAAACLAESEDPTIVWKESAREKIPTDLLYSQGLLVCWQAKVGFSTMKAILLGLIGYYNPGKKGKIEVNDSENTRKILARNFYDHKELEYLMSKSFDPLSKKKPLPVRMLTVRHPFDRLVSCYFEKYRGGDYISVGSPRTPTLKRQLQEGLLKSNNNTNKKGDIRSFSFKEFLIHITKVHNVHWEPYYMKCHPCELEYDYIIHLDTFAQDLKHIYVKAGIDTTNEDIFHTKRNSSPKKVKVEKKTYLEYFKDIPNKLLKEVHSIYRRDFKLFSYEIPDFMLEFEKDYNS